MAKVTSPAPPAFARMTEPSQEPGCRPHLSILIDLICPSYGSTFAEDAPPAMTEATGANENTAQSSNASSVLMAFIGHLPHPTHRYPCVPSLPILAPTLIQTWAVTSASDGHLNGCWVAALGSQAMALP